MAWEQAKADLEEQYPGESRKEYRGRLISKSTRLAISFTIGTRKLRADQQVVVAKVMDHWVDEWATKVKNPDYAPAMDCEETTSTHLIEFVDQVLPGLDEYFICRQKTCSLVCNSTNWIHNHPNGQYRCPACGEQYQAWKDQPGYWRTNKVYITYDEVGLQEGKAELAPGSSDGLAHTNQVMIFPLRWPEAATSVMIDRIKAIFWDIDTDLLAEAPKDRLTFVLNTIMTTLIIKAFGLKPLTAATKLVIDNLNSSPAANKVKWNYSHIEKNGYFGIHLDEKHDLDEPMEMVDLLRTWGLSRWLAERAAAGISIP